MYITLDNGYDGIQVKCFLESLGFYKKGSKLPIKDAGIPKNCILATKYFFDEKEDIEKYVYILIKDSIYINCFTKLEDIKGDYPIYEDIYYPMEKGSKYGWKTPSNYKEEW